MKEKYIDETQYSKSLKKQSHEEKQPLEGEFISKKSMETKDFKGSKDINKLPEKDLLQIVIRGDANVLDITLAKRNDINNSPQSFKVNIFGNNNTLTIFTSREKHNQGEQLSYTTPTIEKKI